MKAGGNDKKCKNCGHDIFPLEGSWVHRGGRRAQVRINPQTIPNPENVSNSCPVDGCECHNPEPNLVDK